MIKFLKRMNKRRQTLKELSAMSDKDLADIGINRYDIKSIIKDIM
jgi:uncharacterized protein YjiS (DUF1127 family)